MEEAVVHRCNGAAGCSCVGRGIGTRAGRYLYLETRSCIPEGDERTVFHTVIHHFKGGTYHFHAAWTMIVASTSQMPVCPDSALHCQRCFHYWWTTTMA